MFAYIEHFTGMTRVQPNPTSLDEIGRRLKLTREALGHTQATLARLMGSSTDGQAVGNYETGLRRISIDHALALCASLGLTLDWIYRGSIHTLPADIIERIQVQMKLEQDEARKRRATRS